MTSTPTFRKHSGSPTRRGRALTVATEPRRGWAVWGYIASGILLLAGVWLIASRVISLTDAQLDGQVIQQSLPPAPLVTDGVLSSAQLSVLEAAVSARITARSHLNEWAVDGRRQLFSRAELDAHLSQLGTLPQTADVVETISQIKELNDTYYENGFRKDEYALQSHLVEPGETPSSIAQQFGVTVEDLIRYNPRDVTQTAIRPYNGKLPRLFFFKKLKTSEQ